MCVGVQQGLHGAAAATMVPPVPGPRRRRNDAVGRRGALPPLPQKKPKAKRNTLAKGLSHAEKTQIRKGKGRDASKDLRLRKKTYEESLLRRLAVLQQDAAALKQAEHQLKQERFQLLGHITGATATTPPATPATPTTPPRHQQQQQQQPQPQPQPQQQQQQQQQQRESTPPPRTQPARNTPPSMKFSNLDAQMPLNSGLPSKLLMVLVAIIAGLVPDSSTSQHMGTASTLTPIFSGTSPLISWILSSTSCQTAAQRCLYKPPRPKLPATALVA